MFRDKLLISLACGTLLWGLADRANTQSISFVKRYDLHILDGANCVRQTLDGGYIITGTLENNFFERSGYILKTNSSGEWSWIKGVKANTSNAVVQLEDSGYVYIGESNSLLVVRTNSRGDTLWTRKPFPGEGNAVIRFLCYV